MHVLTAWLLWTEVQRNLRPAVFEAIPEEEVEVGEDEEEEGLQFVRAGKLVPDKPEITNGRFKTSLATNVEYVRVESGIVGMADLEGRGGGDSGNRGRNGRERPSIFCVCWGRRKGGR